MTPAEISAWKTNLEELLPQLPLAEAKAIVPIPFADLPDNPKGVERFLKRLKDHVRHLAKISKGDNYYPRYWTLTQEADRLDLACVRDPSRSAPLESVEDAVGEEMENEVEAVHMLDSPESQEMAAVLASNEESAEEIKEEG